MSPHQRAANRANARKSTGPKSTAGKQRSAMNALRHGLTGQVIVLPSDDLTAYEKHTQAFHAEYLPQGPTETHLTQTIADGAWRLNRIRAMETNLLALGLNAHVDRTYSGHPQADDALATATGTADHIRQLAILSLHESRLTRQFDKTLIQLRALQSERKAQTQIQLEAASRLLLLHDQTARQKNEEPSPYNPQEDGFVFSTQAIAAYILLKTRKNRAEDAYFSRAA